MNKLLRWLRKVDELLSKFISHWLSNLAKDLDDYTHAGKSSRERRIIELEAQLQDCLKRVAKPTFSKIPEGDDGSD